MCVVFKKVTSAALVFVVIICLTCDCAAQSSLADAYDSTVVDNIISEEQGYVEEDYKCCQIRIISLPEKRYYIQGVDELNTWGGKLQVVYENGYEEEIDITFEMISGFNNTIIGEQVLTVNYSGQEAFFNIEIVEPYYLGDVNNDGFFSIEDSADLRCAIIGTVNTNNIRSCDFNSDDTVDICDLVLWREYREFFDVNCYVLCKNPRDSGGFDVLVIDGVNNVYCIGECNDITDLEGDDRWDEFRESIFSELIDLVYWSNGQVLYNGARDGFDMSITEEGDIVFVNMEYVANWYDYTVVDYTIELTKTNDYILTVTNIIGNVESEMVYAEIGDRFVKCIPYSILK